MKIPSITAALFVDFTKNDKPVDWSGSGETPTGAARAEAPGLSVAREKAEAVPVESEPTVAEINFP